MAISISKLRAEWFGNIKGDILAGTVVALALIPEAIAFSIIAGVDPQVGLYASFSIAVIIAIVGGRPHTFNNLPGPGPAVSFRHKVEAHVVKIGLNYHFTTGPSAVVARY